METLFITNEKAPPRTARQVSNVVLSSEKNAFAPPGFQLFSNYVEHVDLFSMTPCMLYQISLPSRSLKLDLLERV